jgi:hypothetical protein
LQLRDYTAKSEAAVLDFKTKLQTSLEEGVKLLESLHQLESDKATLEERISAMQEGLSQTVMHSQREKRKIVHRSEILA